MKEMVEEILTAAKESTYDFQKTAYPEDPLRHLFSDWVSYYRLKWAIARVLQPKSILEIGVRFGYSALAFLDASPSARYVGIDLDIPTFGGSVGAIHWARKACRQYDAEFVMADSMKMERFPGGRYDLIHVDGQQDGSGTMHDLMLAASQASHILLDGYFWSRSNLFAASEFLYRYRDLIESSHVIPGYAGELLIRLKIHDATGARAGTERAIVSPGGYTRDCYLSDELYRHGGGVALENGCLATIARLASAGPVGRALDIQCGGGDLSIKLAERGFEVTAIDDSRNAIQIARETISGAQRFSSLISFECNDINRTDLRGQYGVVVGVDVIEHLKPSELDRLYQRIAEHLSQDGLFIVHTYPNLWYYKYEHRRRLKIAGRIGAYLPAEPRSRYELIMHINEQSPRVLKLQLGQYFPHVHLWFGHPENVGENLQRKLSISEMRAAPDLFAVASHSPIPVAKLLSQTRMEALEEAEVKRIEISVGSYPSKMRISSHQTLSVELRNNSMTDLKSVAPYPVHLAYHWLSAEGKLVEFDGERSLISPDAKAGTSDVYEMKVAAPMQPGCFLLRITLVQERIRWFDQIPNGVYCDLEITCSAF
jgi:SAM-dependent methyltransferase